MNIVEKYSYTPLVRNTPAGGIRHYLCPRTGKMLPSVTSIIDYTSDRTGLLEWRARVGNRKADEIQKEALGLGTLMHTHLEAYLAGRPRPSGNNLVRQQAEMMANRIIEEGLVNIPTVYGSEVGLYIPGLYAGTADGIGLWQDEPCVFDFKTTRKMKKREHIEGYLIQLCAYGMAHNELFGTAIKTGVIFMVDRDYTFQQFTIQNGEFNEYSDKWLDRLEQYYNCSKSTAHA